MYKKEINKIKEIIKGTLVVEKPDNMRHLDKKLHKLLDIFYENTYEDAYSQGWDEGRDEARKERRKAEINDPFGDY